jgi:type I restriction enzyme M protein
LLNSDTKRHIDAARDVLVGVAPNPTTQIDQITYALIYKFMDDMDQASIKAGGEASFFVGDLEKYAWSNLMSTRMGNQEKMDLYSDALSKFSLAKQLPELFRTIFRAASLPYRSPETLGLFLKEISYFDYTHPEELGNAYEYLLSIMSSQGDAGQFRTPRHIIDFIVDVIDPTKDDKVLDPACGTGGFLVSTYNHILEQHDGKDDPKKKEKQLTPDDRKKLMSNLHGYDIDPTMVRIAQVNMYLHQFKNPQIFQYDSLTSEERWNDKYDVILANPPFMSPKGGIKPHNKFSFASNRAEVLFVDYIINHLKPKGRAGIIVPEGVIFQSGKAYKALRKNLVENGLYAVVSLPGGVFQPYSGVKTSILFLDNELAKQNPDIAFVKISADGYDLGSSKRPIAQNDLPTALELLQSWRGSKKTENSITTFVSKDDIASTPDYDLVGGRYSANHNVSNTTWPIVKLDSVCDLVRGVTFSKNDEVHDAGQGVLTASNLKLDGTIDLGEIKFISRDIQFKDSQKLLAGDTFICLASGSQTHVGKVAYVTSHLGLYFGGFMGAIRTQREILNSKYLYYLLRSARFNEYLGSAISGANIKNLSAEILGKYDIPLPPLEVQVKLVADLDAYAAIISGARQIIDNWRPRFDSDPRWEKAKLSNLCSITTGKRDANHGNPTGKFHFFTCAKEHTYIDDFAFDTEALLIAGNGDVGAIKYFKGKFDAYQRTYVLTNFEKVLGRFLYFSLEGSLRTYLDKIKQGNTMPYIKLGMLKDYEISLPPMEVQKKLVDEIETEIAVIDSAKKLKSNYEQLSNEAIAKLWEDTGEIN